MHFGVVDLYGKVLKPSFNNWICYHENNRLRVWQEHIRSSIIRSIIEGCYPFALKGKSSKFEPTVAIVCPPDEQLEPRARIISDYFTMHGFKSTFVGRNTPVE
jgi:methanogenic corrinoid protein MtbC1